MPSRRPFRVVAYFCFLFFIFIATVQCLPQNEEDSSEPESDPEPEAENEPQPTTTTVVAEIITTAELYQETTVTSSNVCDAALVTSCLMNLLDEWAWNLYAFRDNIATINDTVCEHHKQLSKCVDGFPDCTRKDVLNISSTVSDLLLHRTDSGTFLKSFFLNSYTCTEEGMELVNRNRECLLKNRINHEVAKTSTFVEEQFRLHIKKQNSPQLEPVEGEEQVNYEMYYCNVMTTQLEKLYLFVLKECNIEAAFLTCKSLTDSFVSIFPDNLNDCSVPCTRKPTTTAPPPPPTVVVGSEVDPPGGQPPLTSDEETAKEAKDTESGTNSKQDGANGCNTLHLSLWMFVLVAGGWCLETIRTVT